MATILSTGVRQNLSSLQSIKSQETVSQSRLATGKKVNSALDNPVNFFTSASLNDRAGDLTNLLDGISNSVQTLQAASKGIESITNLVKSAQSAAKQALQTADAASDATVTGTTANLKSSMVLTADLGAGNFSGSTSIVITTGSTSQGGTTTKSFAIDGTTIKTVGDLVNAINNSSLDVSASLDDSGKLKIEETGGEDLNITGASGLGVADGSKSSTTSKTRDQFRTQFNDILTQVDQLAKDSGYNGINLLMGNDLKTTFNEKTGNDQSSMSISGVVFNSSGLGLDKLVSGAFQTNKQVTAVLDTLTTALSTLRTQSSTFGSNLSVVQTRQDFTNGMIDTLKVGADNLVAADTNAESANLLALQTRQQLSTKALSLANQADQSVLSLF